MAEPSPVAGPGSAWHEAPHPDDARGGRPPLVAGLAAVLHSGRRAGS